MPSKSYWNPEVLWLHPPEYLLSLVEDKIMREQAQGILIVLVNFQKKWFQSLATIAVHWWDVPLHRCVRLDPDGKKIPADYK